MSVRGKTRFGYQTHYVADGAKAWVILAVLVTPSEVTENRPMLDLLWRTIFRWHARPHQVTGDAPQRTSGLGKGLLGFPRSLLPSTQARFSGSHYGLRPVGYLQLQEDVRDVVSHRLLAHVQT
jgi:hypothetical protein